MGGLWLWRLAAVALVALGASGARAGSPLDWVDVHIGTGSGPVGYGRTMPFVVPPFGMTSWTPQTRQNKPSRTSYKYEDSAISGFMGTHQPALWMGDYGYVTLMPEIGGPRTAPEDRKLAYAHSDEVARPDYYSVWMTDKGGAGLRAEMTASARAAYLRFTFPSGADAGVLVEASRPGHQGFARVDAARHEVVGFNPDRMDANLGPDALPNFKGYFVVRFRQDVVGSQTYPEGGRTDGPSGAYVRLRAGAGGRVDVRVGTSFISIDQARRNLDAEIPDWNFEAARSRLRAEWTARLDRFRIEGATPAQRRIFYTALYHALLYPRRFSEQGRYYSAFDDTVHQGASYTDYSLWDIFRAEFSLLTLAAPDRAGGMVQALLQDYREGGWMPKWPNPAYTNIMISTHADSLVAEAMVKGIGGFDRNLAWDAVYKDAMTPPDGDTTRRWADREPHTPYEARAGLTYLKALGYIPVDRTAEAASSTLEDAYDDFAVAQVAKSLRRDADYRFFLKRSLTYRNLFNPALGFMQGRNLDGSWADIHKGWTEGGTWVYTWDVLHDIPGLVRLMGGPAAYDAKLDAYFAGDHNWHSNEPAHHLGYLYDYGGQPWKTQAKVREIAEDEYADAPSGLDGDDDCGQMSAWYVFTALGFYPVNPASGDYMIGSPLFPRATLRLANGRRFTVVAEGDSAKAPYIQSATLDGRPLTAPVLHYSDIMRGATLRLVMGSSPSRWGADWTPAPLSDSPDLGGRP